MNIETVAANLRKTIAGKEMMLTTYENPSVNPYPKFVKETMIQMLTTNIAELKRILQDVEQCVAKEVEQSWRDNPDRSGGQFTEEKIGFKPDGAW